MGFIPLVLAEGAGEVLISSFAACKQTLWKGKQLIMKRVTGIGGIFFSAKDPKALCAWYKTHLGIDVQDWGGAAFDWTDADGNPTKGTTAWLIDAAGGNHFAPSKATFMVNYRVEDLAALLQALRDEGCDVLEKTDDSEYGKFGWVMDPEGNKVELWQPPAGQ
jgi:predicted enzyme related to lactoylglutathione lyase